MKVLKLLKKKWEHLTNFNFNIRSKDFDSIERVQLNAKVWICKGFTFFLWGQESPSSENDCSYSF